MSYTTTSQTITLSKIYNEYPTAETYLPEEEVSVAFEKIKGLGITATNIHKDEDNMYYYINGKEINNENIKVKCNNLLYICEDIRDEKKLYQIDFYLKYTSNKIYILDIQKDGESIDYKNILKYIKKYNFSNLPIIKIGSYDQLIKLNKECIIYSVYPIYSNLDKRNIRRYTEEIDDFDIWDKNI